MRSIPHLFLAFLLSSMLLGNGVAYASKDSNHFKSLEQTLTKLDCFQAPKLDDADDSASIQSDLAIPVGPFGGQISYKTSPQQLQQPAWARTYIRGPPSHLS